MNRLRHHLLPILIMAVTFVSPICFLRTISMWLEWYDHWIFFVWGQWSEISRVVEISLLNEHIHIMSLANRILFSIIWVVLGIILIISYYFDVQDSRNLARGLVTALLVLIFQIILPLLPFGNWFMHIQFDDYIPVPLPSLIMIFYIVLNLYVNRKPPSV